MFTDRPLVIVLIFAAIFVLSAVTLAQTKNNRAEIASNDQAQYAEIATTTDETVLPLASTTSRVNVPIVVYHIVRPSYPDDSPAVKALAVTPEVFDAQMAYLRRAGYHVIPLRALEDYFLSGIPLPVKPIAISFDDGWEDQFQYAFPILATYHYTATFFVFTNAIGKHGFLSWDELATLRDAGMTIGSHSRSHPYLTEIASSTELWDEIKGSKDILERHLGIEVREFAYPFGKYTPLIKAMVEEAGYFSARGDFESGQQARGRLYELSALNAPTTTALFERMFSSGGYTPFKWYSGGP